MAKEKKAKVKTHRVLPCCVVDKILPILRTQRRKDRKKIYKMIEELLT